MASRGGTVKLCFSGGSILATKIVCLTEHIEGGNWYLSEIGNENVPMKEKK